MDAQRKNARMYVTRVKTFCQRVLKFEDTTRLQKTGEAFVRTSRWLLVSRRSLIYRSVVAVGSFWDNSQKAAFLRKRGFANSFKKL